MNHMNQQFELSKTLILILIVLVLLTVLSVNIYGEVTWLDSGISLLPFFVMWIALFKVGLVVQYFMEVREGVFLLKCLTTGWLLFLSVLLPVCYLGFFNRF